MRKSGKGFRVSTGELELYTLYAFKEITFRVFDQIVDRIKTAGESKSVEDERTGDTHRA